jgi:hypothetical protein
MATEAAANPIPNADLRSMLFIAFLLMSRHEPPQKRRARFVECEWWCEPKKASVKRACLPMASVLLVRPGRRFRLSRFKGNYILCVVSLTPAS